MHEDWAAHIASITENQNKRTKMLEDNDFNRANEKAKDEIKFRKFTESLKANNKKLREARSAIINEAVSIYEISKEHCKPTECSDEEALEVFNEFFTTPAKQFDEIFTKDDSSKVPLAILFDVPRALEHVAKVMEFGANKYSRKNWSLVDDKERYISASLRHIMKYSEGEYTDAEQQRPHLAAAITSLLFLLEIEEGERNGHS